MNDKSDNTTSALKRLIRDPFLHFILLGGLIFILAAWRDAVKDSETLTIRVDEGLKAYLVNLYNVQFGSNPDTATTEMLIENHIRDEVLFREALRMGLAQQDEIIRRRLVQKMEYLLLDNQVATEPTDEELTEFLRSYENEFTLPARADFQHVYFMDNNEETGDVPAILLLATYRDSGVEPEPAEGDRFPLNYLYEDLSPREVSQLFGQSEFTSAVFSAEIGEWSGPYRSGYGVHLLKVSSRQEGALPDLESVREQVTELWMEEKNQALFQETLNQLVTAYKIERHDKPAMTSEEE